MIKVSGDKIRLTRGDTFNCFVYPMIDKNTKYVPCSGDSIRFAMKSSYESADVLIEKDIPIDTLILTIAPSETKSLDFGTYVYDVQLTHADGDIDTFISGTLKLTEEVD